MTDASEARGANRLDGTLTAIELQASSNTGAYGGHAGETLAASARRPLRPTVHQKGEGQRLRRSTLIWCRPGGFRGYGASRPPLRSETPIDNLAKILGLDPFAIRRGI